MKVLVLVDKFKGTLSSKQIGKIIVHELNKSNINADYFPISDGGDGFLDSINCNDLLTRYCYAQDAYGNYKRVFYLMNKNKVYIEVAKIVGGNYSRLNLFKATSYGIGEVILDAISKGGKEFYIGLGGSMCNDCGKGMLEALKIFENNQINVSKIKLFKNFSFSIISDVDNPLLGLNGATYTFAKQKGAQDSDLSSLENINVEFSNIIFKYLKKDYTQHKGAGAAGGIGFAFLSVLNANYYSGINFVMQYLKLPNISKNYDLIITGEGKIDEQSLHGKVVFEILQRLQKRTLIICAINEIKSNVLLSQNIIGIYSIIPSIANLSVSLATPKKCLKKLLKTIQWNKL